MSARSYFAWNMITAATYQDERYDQANFQANIRKRIENPLKHISENNFIKEYRLNNEAFEDLCDLLVYYTDLRSTQRVSLESKVLCALLFYAHGSYQRVTGKANHFSQEAISVYIEEVTTALNHPDIVKNLIKFRTTRQERDTIKQR
ncbi:hypothetical protein evm_010107 [Chilo suppressalis]|nr:hypothetical protein evm_010107 [Chilo suppressalis]